MRSRPAAEKSTHSLDGRHRGRIVSAPRSVGVGTLPHVAEPETAAAPVSRDGTSALRAGGRPRQRPSRGARLAIQLALSAAVIAYLLWKIDLGETANHIRGSSPLYLAAAVAIWTATLAPMAWRWQVLLASKGIHEPLRWLTKLYFIGYAASQLLPTSIGGDAVRILEHARRRPTGRARPPAPS
jgi:Lysylphosphatidylglycerol synthase TM region